jgi:VanZ family protein
VLNKKHITFLKVYGPAILWGMFILIATLTPGKSLPSSSLFRFDKLIHVVIFGIFAWLVLRAYFLSPAKNSNNQTRIYSIVGIASILFGIAIEGIQQFIPDRGADRYDIIANTVGIIAAQIVFYFVYRKTSHETNNR